MSWVALRMLMGDKGKYFAIIFGISFACFLIAEKSATFCGVMLRTTSQIQDTQGADIWVMNSGVRYIDDLKPISDNDLYRVRSVPGVSWAVNLYRGQGQAQLASVRVNIDEEDIPRLKLFAPARAKLRGDPNQEGISLTFVRLEPFVTPKASLTGVNTERVDTRVVQVIYAIDPKDRLVQEAKILVGQLVDVFIDTSGPPRHSADTDTDGGS